MSFLNSNGGTIFIGIRDDGTVVGVTQIDETLRKISDIITNQIEPNPQDEITAQLKFEQDKTIIAIDVNKGHRYIYCQKKYGFSSMGCTIPFNEKVLSEIKIDNLNNSGISEKISDINGNYGFSINETEKRVVKILINNSQATTSMIAEQIGVTRRTIQRAIASLYSKGIVEKVKSNNLTQLIVKR